MTKEEKSAIEIVKGISEDDLLNYWEGSEEPYNAIQVVINLIQKQDTEINKLNKEIEEWRTAYQEEKDKQFDILKENIKLKDVIDRTTKYIEELIGSCPYDTFDYQVKDCEKECKDQMAECWKEYFMKQEQN